MLSRSERTMFEDAVAAVVPPILSSFGFTLRSAGVWQVYFAESEQLQVIINYALTCVRIDMRLLNEANGQQFSRPTPEMIHRGSLLNHPLPTVSREPIELALVLEVLAPHVPEPERYPRKLLSRKMIPQELRRQLELMVEHLKPLLQGDVELWTRVRDAESSLFGNRQLESESDEDFIQRLRQDALQAMEREEYWRAYRRYSRLKSLGVQITDQELANLKKAQKHTFLVG